MVAVVAAPLAAQRQSVLAPLLYEFFDPICHQIAARSFHLGGEPLAACHRCLGLYLGFALGLLLLPHCRRVRQWLLEHPRHILLFSIPMLVDWTILTNTPGSRFTTGLIAAAPVAVLLWAATRQIFDTSTSNLLGEEL